MGSVPGHFNIANITTKGATCIIWFSSTSEGYITSVKYATALRLKKYMF